MLRKPLNLFDQAVWIQLLNRLYDLRMQCPPAILEKPSISNLMRKRVLESVFEVGKQARLVNKFRRLKVRQLPSEIFLRKFGDGLEQRKRKILADDRSALKQLLRFEREPVNAGGEHGLH